MSEELSFATSSNKISDDSFLEFERKCPTFEVKPFNNFSIPSQNVAIPVSTPIESAEDSKFTLNKPNIAEIESSKSLLEHALANCTLQRRKIGFELNGNSSPEKKKMNSKFLKNTMTFFWVKKFLRKLKGFSNIRNSKVLELIHYQFLNELFYSQSKRTNKLSFGQRILTKLQTFICFKEISFMGLFGMVFLPTNKLRLFWDFIQIIINLQCFGIIPLCVSFDLEIFNENKIWTSLMFLTIAFDFIVNFNTAFYSKGELIISKKQITKHYLKTFFFYDFFSLSFLILNGIFGLSIENLFLKVSAFFFLFRIRDLSKAISRFEDFLFINEKTENIIGFMKLIFIILLFSHWSACIWIFIGKVEESSSWIIYYGLRDESFFKQYVNALYYIVVVINTVGFGDIVSTTTIEKGFTIVFIYIACVIFGITLNRIGMILQNINRSSRELKRSLNLINGFMKSKNIDFNLKIKIKNYLEYIWQEEKKNQKETQEIINKLSKSLREELLSNANGKVIKETPLLNKNFSETTLRQILSEMHELNLTPGDLIYSENDVDDNNLYLIKDGEIDLYLEGHNENKRICLKILRKGDFFGEKSFFCGIPRLSCARSVSFSSLFVINKDDFLRVLKQNPDDFERFCEIRDQINLNDDWSKLYLKCESCNSLHHSLFTCPLLHLVLPKKRIILRSQYSLPQVRNEFLRKRSKKMFNSFSNFNKIQRKAVRFAEDLESPRDEDSNENNEVSGSLEYLESVSFGEKDHPITNSFSTQGNPEITHFQLTKLQSEKEVKKDISDIRNNNLETVIKSPGIRKNPENIIDDLTMSIDFKKRKESNTLSSYSKMTSSIVKGRKSIKEKSRKELSEMLGKTQSFNTCTSLDQHKADHLNFIGRISFEVDAAKIYYYYYPDQNYDEIVEKITKYNEKNMKRLKSVFNFFNSNISLSSQQNLRTSNKQKKRQTEISLHSMKTHGNQSMISNGLSLFSKSQMSKSSRKKGVSENAKKSHKKNIFLFCLCNLIFLFLEKMKKKTKI